MQMVFMQKEHLCMIVGIFFDGTVRPICWPQETQRVVYNGHKRVHAIKFQSVVTPNRIIANLYGPVEGCRHGSVMLAYSGLLQQLQQHSYNLYQEPTCLYRDLAYPLCVHLQDLFPTQLLTNLDTIKPWVSHVLQ